MSHFLEVLYSENEEEETSGLSESEGEFEEDDDAGLSLEAPPYSPIPSPITGDSRRSRSRSPLSSWSLPPPEEAPMGMVLAVYGHEGNLLVEDAGMEDAGLDDNFLVPDAHLLYARDVNYSESGLSERGTSGRRGGRRGVRGLRGRSGRGRGRRERIRCERVPRQNKRWAVGDPLIEIHLSDNDVPPALLDMVRDVVRNRRLRAQERDRNGSESGDDEEFYDANDTFEWRCMNTFKGKEEDFLVERTGSVMCHNSPYEAFRSYWDDELISRIVDETNLYASTIQSPSFQAEWFDTNKDEILCLFAFWMMLGIIRMPTISSCFSIDPLVKTDIFRKIFNRKRYTNLTRAIHFVENGPSEDKLFKLRPIIDKLNKKFKDNYVLSKEICIDESLTLWKGRLDIKQYIRTKAAKLGIKTFELCESVTGYLWSFIVYTGKESQDIIQTPGELKSTAIVKTLIAPLLNKGYN